MKRRTLKVTFFSLFALAVMSILMISCEQEAIISPTDSEVINDTEGFKSTTNDTDDQPIINEDEVLEPVLRMNFSSDLTEEEAREKWTQAVDDYISSISSTELENRDFSTEWYFVVYTRTGTQTYNDTDGKVYSRVGFDTSKGYYYTPFYRMNNPEDDFEKGDFNYFLFRTYMPGEAVEWVDIKWAQLALKGTDGWFVKDYHVYIFPWHQTVPATHYSYLNSYPNLWLDNQSSNGFDYYYTGLIGGGRLNF